MPPLDCFGEPPSHSYPIGGDEQFDELMSSPVAEQSRKKTLEAIQKNVPKKANDILPNGFGNSF